MYVTHEKLGANLPMCNLELCIFLISKSVHQYYYLKYGILYISHVKIKVKFYSVKNGILYILHVKMSVLNLCHETLNFLSISFYKEYAEFPTWDVYFLYFIYEYMGGDTYIAYGNLYISQMKIMALVSSDMKNQYVIGVIPISQMKIYTTVFS